MMLLKITTTLLKDFAEGRTYNTEKFKYDSVGIVTIPQYRNVKTYDYLSSRLKIV